MSIVLTVLLLMILLHQLYAVSFAVSENTTKTKAEINDTMIIDNSTAQTMPPLVNNTEMEEAIVEEDSLAAEEICDNTFDDDDDGLVDTEDTEDCPMEEETPGLGEEEFFGRDTGLE